jgi:16S rRNA (guanine966-N2)-methyltransferase
MALRVIAGVAGGLRLVAPEGAARPTTDRVKESLFAALGPDAIDGVVVLDLFAGSGALGVEALSRGATRAVFVDRDRHAVDAVRANLATTRLADRAEVHATTAEAYLRRAGDPGFGLVFLDPPYDAAAGLGGVLDALGRPGLLAPSAAVVIETRRDDAPALPVGWVVRWQRLYGDTLVTVASV